MSRFVSPLPSKLLVLSAIGLLLLGASQALLLPAHGAQLGSRTLQLSTPVASKKATYKLGFNLSTAGTLGSVSITVCANTPFDVDPCVTPTGLSLSGAVLSSQSGQTGFSIKSASVNTIVLTRPPAAAGVGSVSYTFDNVTNPNAAGSYYVRLQTFASNDATGSFSDYGGIAYAINSNLSISAEVPPYLIFCAAVSIPTLNCSSASGNYIDFGEFAANRPTQGSSQVVAATNAKNGYNVVVMGTTLTSGNNVITALANNDVSRPGSAQFGMNLRANVSPAGGSEPTGPGAGAPTTSYGQANLYRYVSGESVITVAKPDDIRKYTASYLVNVPKSQAPGVYVSTVTYVCTGNF